MLKNKQVFLDLKKVVPCNVNLAYDIIAFIRIKQFIWCNSNCISENPFSFKSDCVLQIYIYFFFISLKLWRKHTHYFTGSGRFTYYSSGHRQGNSQNKPSVKSVCQKHPKLHIMSSRSERDKQKPLNEKHQVILSTLLKDEDNKYCVDCDAKGTTVVHPLVKLNFKFNLS